MSKISIIVPIYKVEKYLRQCLDSIRAQTFEDWECILVDDGSPDNSKTICNEFCEKDLRFKYLYKENGGLSSARNAGIAIATAPYLGFVDSDDWIEPEMFEIMYNTIREYDADFVECSFVKRYLDFDKVKSYVREKSVLDRKQTVRELYFDRKLPNYIWSKLFKREVFTEKFPEGVNYEDIKLLNSIVKNIKTAVIIPDILYNYRQRRGSILNSNLSSTNIEYFKSGLERLKSFEAIEPDALSHSERIKYIWKMAITGAKGIARMEKDGDKKMGYINYISHSMKNFQLPSFKITRIRLLLRAFLLKTKPELFIKLMNLSNIFNVSGHKHLNSLYD